MKYRADIDGLRAIAVVSIVIFHLGIGVVPGGFVGVDIFFVISGYLIAKIIYSETESFSIAKFYVRRARRILPALIVVLIISSAFAYELLYPVELVAYAKSAIAAMLFSANIYFYSALNYFSPSADEIPLLHLWSLGVEEQFYIFFPLFAVWIARKAKRLLAPILIVTALISVGLSQWMLSRDPSASFYLIPFRAFELLIGCVIALPIVKSPKSMAACEALALLGIAAIAWAVFGYVSFTPFPGLAAALPCVGTALVIYSGEQRRSAVASVMGSKPLVLIGKISYSLYLVHWPIIVFEKRLFPHADHGRFSAAALALSFLLACIIYYTVEQPARRFGKAWRPLLILSISAFAIVSSTASGAYVINERGFPGSVDSRIANIVSYGGYDPTAQFRSGVCFLLDGQHATGRDFSSCLPSGAGEKAMLWGDSHAAMLAIGLGETLRAKGYSFGYMSQSACAPALNYGAPIPPTCREFNDIAYQTIVKMHPALLIMTAEWTIKNQSMMDQLDKTIKMLSAQGIHVVLLGISPFYTRSVPQLVLERIQQGRQLGPAPDELKKNYLDSTEQYMRSRFGGRSDVKYISILDAMCPHYNCPLVTDGEVPVHFDQAHLTIAGSKLFAKDLTPLILN